MVRKRGLNELNEESLAFSRSLELAKANVCVNCSSGWPGFVEERHEIGSKFV